MPIIKVAGFLVIIIIVAAYINISLSKETKNNDQSPVKENFSNNELDKIDEAINFTNLIEAPANIIEEKPLINTLNKLVLSFLMNVGLKYMLMMS